MLFIINNIDHNKLAFLIESYLKIEKLDNPYRGTMSKKKPRFRG